MDFHVPTEYIAMSRGIAIFFLGIVTAFISSSAMGVAEEINRDKLTSQLIKHEGKRTKVYKDSEGIPTIGVGFNLKRADAKSLIDSLKLNYEDVLAGKSELSDEQIGELLRHDIEMAITDCKSVVKNFDSLSDVRKRVLVDMMFNLGKSRFSDFKKMLAAVEASNFEEAAKQMKNSKWCGQVKVRCDTLCLMIREDKDSKN